MNSPHDDGIEVLIPGHFLIGHPLCALSDPAFSFRPISAKISFDISGRGDLLKFNKWHNPSRNFAVGDVVIV